MSTRSFVGTKTPELDYRGRYVHMDGYPEAMVPTLGALLGKHWGDVAALLKILTEEHYGWSYLDPDADGPLGPGREDGRFVMVPGYGCAYTTVGRQSDPADWVTGHLGEANEAAEWLDFGYVFDLDRRVLAVLEVGARGRATVLREIPIEELL